MPVVLSLLVSGCGQAGPPDEAAPAPTARPTSIADLPLGPPTDYPVLAGGALRVGDRAVSTGADRLVFRGGTTLVGTADERHSTWWLLAGDRLVPLLDEAAAYVEPVLSADGGTAAWVVEVGSSEVDASTRDLAWEVVAFDVPTRVVLGRTWLGGRVTCCDQGGMLRAAGVANDGRVTLTGGPAGNLSVWRAGDPLMRVRVRAAAYSGADAWPLGVSWVRESDGGRRVRFGRVDAAGAVTELGVVSQTALWSADGRLVVDRVRSAPAGTTRVEVRVAVTGETVGLGLPSAHDWQVLAWEDASHVLAALVRTSDAGATTYASLVRCDAVSGSCERTS